MGMTRPWTLGLWLPCSDKGYVAQSLLAVSIELISVEAERDTCACGSKQDAVATATATATVAAVEGRAPSPSQHALMCCPQAKLQQIIIVCSKMMRCFATGVLTRPKPTTW